MKKSVAVMLFSIAFSLASPAAAQGPSGTIAYAAFCDYNQTNTSFCNVFLVAADGSRGAGIGDGTTPAWSPDGSRIAFAGYRQPGVFVWSLGDGSVVQLPISGPFAWSPDGQKLVLSASRSCAATSVRIVDVSGSVTAHDDAIQSARDTFSSCRPHTHQRAFARLGVDLAAAFQEVCMSTRLATVQFDPSFVDALQVQLNVPHFGVQYPIRLTAQNACLSGRAALVFVSPHALSPADDMALFGEWFLVESEPGFDFKPPHQGARLVAWFRPPEAGRKYNIDFAIEVSPGSYSLTSNDGTETTEVKSLLPADKQLSTTFHASSNEWLSFTISGTGYWRFTYCELNLLP